MGTQWRMVALHWNNIPSVDRGFVGRGHEGGGGGVRYISDGHTLVRLKYLTQKPY